MKLEAVDSPKIPKEFYYKLRQRFSIKMREEVGGSAGFNTSVSFFKGIESIPKNHCDTDHLVEQECTFLYLFGVHMPDCYGLIHNATGKATLFIPRHPEIYQMWMKVKSQQQIRAQTSIEEVCYVDEIQAYFHKIHPSLIYLCSGVDSDSGLATNDPDPKYLTPYQTDKKLLWCLISNLRVIKTEEEMEYIRYVCKLTSEAILRAIRSAKEGLTQMQIHSVFHFEHSIHSGSTLLGFDSICSSGRDCATLHYIDNDLILRDGELMLVDVGGKWGGYVADQAITFPINGVFTPHQREIYNTVYEAQRAVLAEMKAGVSWEAMHLLAEKVILTHLIRIGIVHSFPLEQLIAKRIGAVFFPHGLGHFFGLRVHDVGGYTKGPPRSQEAGLKNLRTRRVLEEGMCITVEPGVYFVDFLIQQCLKDADTAKYLNQHQIKEYQHVGGVRLEDDVYVTKDGVSMLSHLPRALEDVQTILASRQI